VLQAKDTIADVLSIEDLSEDYRDCTLRLSLVLENLEQSIKSTDANLISTSWLTAAERGVNQINSSLTNFKAQQAHVRKNRMETAVAALDAILENTAKMNLIKSGQSVRGHAKAIEGHTSLINAVVTDFKRELAVATDTVAQLKADYYKVLQLSDEKITAVDKTIELADKKKQELKVEIDDVLDTYKTRFTDVLSDTNEKMVPIIASANEQVAALSKSIDSRHEHFLARYEKMEKRGEEILGIVSRDSFTHDYNKAAVKAQESIAKWNKLAVGSMIAVACFTIVVFIVSMNVDFHWTTIVSKVLVTTAGASISIYAYQKVAKYEQTERYSRRIALELATFDPFVSSLEKTEQDRLKQAITMRLFGNINPADGSANEQQEGMLCGNITIDNLLKIITALKEKG